MKKGKMALLSVVASLLLALFAGCSNSSDSAPQTNPTTQDGGGNTGGVGDDNGPSYSITIEQSAKGSVSSDKATAKRGETVVLTIAPEADCELTSLSVVAGDFVCTATGSGNNRSFAMPDRDVTVKSVFGRVTIFPSTAYEKIDSETMGGVEYDRVKFGDWPQSVKAENVTIDESEISRMGDFTYCKGSDGFWYAKAFENACRSDYKYSDGTIVNRWQKNSYKWFKVEPIEWRVISQNAGVNGANLKKMLSEKILTAKGFDNNSNNYKNSEIRSYINNEFLNSAFSSAQKRYIADTVVDNSARSTLPANYESMTEEQKSYYNNGQNQYACEDTTDKIYLFSYREADYTMRRTTSGGFEGWLKRRPTDYSFACGLWCGDDNTILQNTWWWLRSPYYKDLNDANGYINGGKGSYYIEIDGKYISVRIITNGNGGIVPVLRYDETGSASAGSSGNALSESSVESAHLKAEAVDGGIKYTVKDLGETYKDNFWLEVSRDGYGTVGRIICEWNDKSANWTGVYPFVNAGSSYTAQFHLYDAQDVESQEQVKIKATSGSGEMNYAGDISASLEVSNEKISCAVVNYPPYSMPVGAVDKKFYVQFFAGEGWVVATLSWDGSWVGELEFTSLVSPDSSKKCVYEISSSEPIYSTLKNAMTNQYPNKKLHAQFRYRYRIAGLSAICETKVVDAQSIEPTVWRQ